MAADRRSHGFALLPTAARALMMRCPLRRAFDSHDPAGSYAHCGHVFSMQATDEIRR